MLIATVRNLPKHPLNKWIVVRYVDGELWYYGTWHTDERIRADKVAKELGNGLVLEHLEDSLFDV